MDRQEGCFTQHISRRLVLKGLVGLTFAISGVSCAPSAVSPTSTKTTPRAASSPSAAAPLVLGSTLYTYNGHSRQVNSVAWSPDGKRIASGSSDMTVQVWDATTGGHVLTYNRHERGVNSVAWSADGRRIVSGGEDETAQVWDAVTGRPIFVYRGHTDRVNTVAWSPDSKYIATGSGGELTSSGTSDTTVRVWKAQ